MIQQIVDFFKNAADWIDMDYILYGSAGLTALVFIAVLLCGGYTVRFRKAASGAAAYLRSNTGTEELDQKMEKFAKPVKGAWKNYRAASNDGAAVYLTQHVCVDAPAAGSGRNAARNYFFGVILIACVSFFINLLIIKGAPIGANEAVAPLASLILGAVFSVVLGIVFRSRYNKALTAYNDLIACLNAYLPKKEGGPMLALPVGATVLPETFRAAETAEQPMEHIFEAPAPSPAPEVREEKETPKESFAPPAFTAPSFVAPAPSFEEPVYPYADPRKEDVVAQIERITAAGASKQTMLEVAKLLQAERAKAENKTPEQQRRLNSALATLLKAISAANTGR